MKKFESLLLAFYFSFVGLFLIVNAGIPDTPVAVRPCPGVESKASLVGVYIGNCTVAPCTFTKGQNVEMEMDIDFLQPVERLEAQLYALIFGAPVKWEGVNPEACEDIVSIPDTCPLRVGAYITYGVKFYVERQYPTITTDVQYLLLDENGDTQICWIVRASVKPAE
ncbi:unnamed protein product [Orchesella dallaii]|uniref:MD-2-related lipid-recognition domain-containing protein n=1 Tax=Orchesella dallaii TaxID=48710 RepID=A0ABP1R6D2_9HEXA